MYFKIKEVKSPVKNLLAVSKEWFNDGWRVVRARSNNPIYDQLH